MKRLSILGAGSWGTALALALSPRFDSIHLWVYEKDLAAKMHATRENQVFLPGFRLPDNVEFSTDIADSLNGAEFVLGVMPSHHARHVYAAARPALHSGQTLVSATKGLENGSLLRMTQVIQEVTGFPVAALSGPTFAREVARGEPTALVVASEDSSLASRVQSAFSGPAFRLYTHPDAVGVEMGAALKNVIAIGAGVCAGLGLGSNSMAALITRGLAEITRLAVSLGGKPLTLAGLAGLGDLVLTCTGELSRNRTVGMELAKGRKLDDIVDNMRMVAEGVQTTYAAVDLAQRQRVEMPITSQMDAIFRHGKAPRDAIRDLMDRTLKGE